MAKILERFTIARAVDGFMLSIEDDAGDTVEMTMTEDQLDLIAEEVERALDEDIEDDIETDASDEVDEE